jgi:type I restriction enzyme S subunit
VKSEWKTKMLADTCEVFADGDWVESKDQSPEGIRLIQTGNVGGGVFKDRGEKARYISEETFNRLRCTEIFESDCLISRLPDPAGRSCMLPDTGERMITAVDCTIVRFDLKHVVPEFFIYYSQSHEYLSVVDSETTGTTRKRISRSKLGQIPIPVPPLPEQQRIVGILDDAFDGIATVKAKAEKNLQNARALFESHLQAVFTQRGEGWVEKRLQDVCEKITDGTHQTPTYFDKGVVFLSSKNVTSGKINWDNIKYIDTKQHLEMHRRVAPRLNDILLAKNGTTGVAAMVDRDVIFDIYVSLALIRSLGFVTPKFLLHFINSPVAKQQFNKRLKGVGVPNLHLEEIREVVIRFPSTLEQQNTIVAEIDALQEETQHLESLYQRKLASLDELKKSLLHRAFSGEL